MTPTDTLTFTMRIHDPAEKKDASKATCWVVCQIPRSALTMKQDEFIQQFIVPNLKDLKLLELN